MNKSRAKTIGLNACINSIGRTYFFENKDNAMSGYGIINNEMMCFAGVGHIQHKFGEADEFENKVVCYVNLDTGKIRYEGEKL